MGISERGHGTAARRRPLGSPQLRPRAQKVARWCVFGVLLVALIGSLPTAASAEGPAETSVPEFELPPLGSSMMPPLGPASGLAALVGRLAFGDPAATLEGGARGGDVALVQSRLERLGFRPGPIDGVFGGQTYSAVLAFQKHEGLERTGVVDPDTRAALDGLEAASQRADLLGDRMEIDLRRQLIFVVMAGEVVSILNTSTGNGQPYLQSNGNTAIARTPVGSFALGRRVNGVETGFLGSLYRPIYFSGPYAIHGSGSVPGYPASHGCARTSYADMDWLWGTVPTGLQVYSYWTEEQPETSST